jgi:NADH-quinone oxidoreductase subunit L
VLTGLVALEPVMEVQAATGIEQMAWLLVALPLAGAVILLLGGRRTNAWGHWLGLATITASFVLGVAIFAALLGEDASDRARDVALWDWISTAFYSVDVGLLVDQLSIVFVLLITGVGAVIHLYSVGYMADDRDRRRFFAYLNFFVAAMLLLVLADDFLVLYVGWEGVGLASYLLIGFWYQRPTAAVAAKKAFVVNRVGDVGMSLGLIFMVATFGSTKFEDVFASAGAADEAIITAIGLMLLLAACGKSAQFPLQSWLLDAMEGPTPVSALIHAATMVTAGVYLIVRAHAIFEAAPAAQTAVVVVGALTLLIGAVIGSAKDDIKKALAGSTMSQIGYMMLAAGLGPIGYAFAIFHLLTHGFFKANLFLGAGSVMHGMNDEVNMRRFGALRTVMVITYVTFGIGYLAIIGIPPFAGFWSKDKIIEVAFTDSWWAGLAALLGAGITAFYMTRLMLMTFLGDKRWEKDAHPHESPLIMTVPLMILAVLSAVGGLLLFVGGGIVEWLEPVVGQDEHEPPIPVLALTGLTLIVIVSGVLVAFRMYGAGRTIPRTAPTDVTALTRAARRDLYGDAINEAAFMRPGQYLTRSLVYVDNRWIDGLVNGLAAMLGGSSSRLRRWQTGYVRSYALSMFGGAVLVVAALAVVML